MASQQTDNGGWGGFPFLLVPPEEITEELVEDEEPDSAPVRMTAPQGSQAFTMTDHIICLSGTDRRAFQEGSLALPAACAEGHPKSPTPQERGLVS